MTSTTTIFPISEAHAARLRHRVVDFWDGMLGLMESQRDAIRQSGGIADRDFVAAAKIVCDQLRLDTKIEQVIKDKPTAQPPTDPLACDDPLTKIRLKAAS